MITTNYQTYGTSGFNLRLRVYQDGETRYVNVNKILQGKLKKSSKSSLPHEKGSHSASLSSVTISIR